MAVIALPTGYLNIKTTGVDLNNRYTAATAISAGQWLYEASGTTVDVADASTAAKAAVIGIAPWDFASGDTVYFVENDDVDIDGFLSMPTTGEKLVLSGSANAGQMELLSDLTASEFITYLCTPQSATKLKTKIEATGLTA